MYTKLRAEQKIDLHRTFSNVRRRVYGTWMWWSKGIPGGVPQKLISFTTAWQTNQIRHHDVQ
jgi:hypothetical protein